MLISCLSWYSFVPFLSSESLYTSLSLFPYILLTRKKVCISSCLTMRPPDFHMKVVRWRRTNGWVGYVLSKSEHKKQGKGSVFVAGW